MSEGKGNNLRTKEQNAKYYQNRKLKALKTSGLSYHKLRDIQAQSNGYKNARDQTRQRKKERERIRKEESEKAEQSKWLDQFAGVINIDQLEELPPDRKRAIDILIEKGVDRGYLKEKTIEELLSEPPESFWPSIRPYLDQTPSWI